MSKRGNNIYKRKDKRWEGRFYIKGTKKYRSVYGKTYTETRDKLRRLAVTNTPVGYGGIMFNTMRIYIHTSLDRKTACMNLLAPLA